MTTKTPKDPGQLKLRVPIELKSTLQKKAVRNRRTVTMEIVARLERSVANEPAGESA